MTNEERWAFEDLLSAGRAAIRHLGKEMPLAEVMVYSMRYTKAANAVERILDPMRTTGERRRVEREVEP